MQMYTGNDPCLSKILPVSHDIKTLLGPVHVISQSNYTGMTTTSFRRLTKHLQSAAIKDHTAENTEPH